jgi:hypothetical protein
MKNKKSKSKSNFHALEVIKEEDKDIKDIDIQIGNNTNENYNDNKVKNDNRININSHQPNSNSNIKENKVNKTDDMNTNNQKSNNSKSNNNIIINNKIEISALNETPKEKEKEKDSLVMKLLSNPKYSGSNNKLNPIRLTPIIKNPNNIQSSTNIINNNNNNYQNIDKLKIGLGMAPNGNQNKIMNYYGNDNIKTRYPTKIILKDDKNFGKFYDINAQSNLPKNNPPTASIFSGRKGEKYNTYKRPESNGVYLPMISNNNNLNVSRTTLSNDTNSVYSNLTTGKKFEKNSINNYGKSNSRKKDEILLLQQECREAIEKAKSEWNFTNKDVEAILVNKIKKKYNKKINALLHKNMV